MKKRFITMASAAVLSVAIAGCTPGHNVAGATAAGAIAGGVLGSAFFHGRGSFAGVVGGALIGGIIGNIIGNQMDARDRANMQSAITNVPVGKSATWTNEKERITYTVTPMQNYHRRGRFCRRYKTRVRMFIHGRWQTRTAWGRACRDAAGRWAIVR